MRRILALLLVLIAARDASAAIVTSTTASFKWTKATDDRTPQNLLQYAVCQSRTNSVGSVALCEAALISPWMVDSDAYTATGLTPATAYWWNVVVRDADGLKAVYAGFNATTAAPDPPPPDLPPVPGAGGLISVSNINSSSLMLSWILASDDKPGLFYEVRKSSADDMTTVADAERNGTVIKSYTSAMSSFKPTGLKTSQIPFFTVIVMDSGGNKAAYKTVRAHYAWSAF